MTQRNVYTSGTHLAPALVVPEGGGTAVRIDTVAYQAAGNHAHADATWSLELETGTAGFITGAEKNKLNTIDAGAEANAWRISSGANNALADPVYGWSGTTTQYALLTPSNDTLYFVTGGTVTVAEAMKVMVPVTGNANYQVVDVNYAGTVYRITDVRLLGGTAPTATIQLRNGTTSVDVTGCLVNATTGYSVDAIATANATFTARQVLSINVSAIAGSPEYVELTVHITKQII